MRIIGLAQRAEDLECSIAFYTDLFGQSPSAVLRPSGLVFFDLDGVRLMLEQGTGFPHALMNWSLSMPPSTASGRPASRRPSEPHVIFSHADETARPGWGTFGRRPSATPQGNLVGLGRSNGLPVDSDQAQHRSWSVSPTCTMPIRS